MLNENFFLIPLVQNNTFNSDISKVVTDSGIPLVFKVVFKEHNISVQVLVAMFLVQHQMQ